MTISKKKIIKLYVAFCICMDADVFLRIFGELTPSANGRSGVVNNPVMFSFTATLILGTVVLLLPIARHCLKVLLNTPWLTGIYVWSVITIFWSPTPAMIVRGGTAIWAFLLCGVIASKYLELGEVADLICTVVFFLALLSIFFQLNFPVRETMAPGWTGVYGEKNHLGIGMGVGCIAQMASTRRWGWLRGLQTATFVVLLGLSQSTTSMVFVFATTALYLLFRLPKRVRPLATATLTGTVVLAFALIPNLTGTLFSMTGKNTNFTGRDVIWAFTLQQWKTKPIQGYGLYSFWEAEDTLIEQQLGWNPRQAHNGILEVGVTMGIVGVVLLLGCIASGALLITRAWRRGHRTAAMWLLLSWMAIMIDNVTEADYMIPGPLWFTYCLVYYLTYAELRRGAQQRQQTRMEAALVAQRTLPAYALARGGITSLGWARDAGRL